MHFNSNNHLEKKVKKNNETSLANDNNFLLDVKKNLSHAGRYELLCRRHRNDE